MRGTSDGNWAIHNYEDRSGAEVIPHDELFLGHFGYHARNLRKEEVPTAEEVLGHFKERVIGLSETEAIDEAKRCMSCGMCFECDNCVIFCPQDAVYPGREGREHHRALCGHRLCSALAVISAPMSVPRATSRWGLANNHSGEDDGECPSQRQLHLPRPGRGLAGPGRSGGRKQLRGDGSRAADEKSCVEPTDFMRRNHMEVIKHQRDETVHGGIRSTKHSLAGCIACHGAKGPTGEPAARQ